MMAFNKKEYQKLYRQRNKDRLKIYYANWRANNKEKEKVGGDRWRAANPERVAYTRQKANAKRRGIEFVLTFDEWRSWWGDDFEKRGKTTGCLVMARPGDTGPYSLDNIIKATVLENRQCAI